MKLIRVGEMGSEKPAVLENNIRLDVSAFGEDYDGAFFSSNGQSRLAEWLETNRTNCPIIDDSVRLGSPIGMPSKFICVGLNYAAHARESGLEPPTSPVLFSKATSAICGPFDNVIIPKGSEKTDWEVELAFVIGKKASYVSEAEAMDYVAGYMVHNDVSERAFQLEHGGQWLKGKGADTFAPLGPWLVTKDEIADPNNLHLWLKVNGESLQDSSTSDFIFDVALCGVLHQPVHVAFAWRCYINWYTIRCWFGSEATSLP